MIIVGILLIVDFILEIIDITDLASNEYFDKVFVQVYAILIVGYAVSVVLFIVYFFLKNTPKTRPLVPWALGIAAVVNFLIVVWIIVYICVLYKRDKVYITNGKRMEDEVDDPDWHNDEDSPGQKKMKYVK